MDGRCSRFTDYIMSALTKQGCHHQYDVEGALQRIVFKMLGAVGERGLPHKSLFDFDESRPYNLRLGNPLRVMFKKYLSNEIRAISMGCIPSIRTIQRPGRLSIGYGRDDPGTVSPDDIPDRAQTDEPEMTSDLLELLRKQSTPNLNLVDLFYSIINKEGSEVQSRRFGMSQVANGRRMIVQTIEQLRPGDTELAHAPAAGPIQRTVPEPIRTARNPQRKSPCEGDALRAANF